MIETHETPLGLREYADVLRRHLLPILAFITLLVVAAVLFTVSRVDAYTAEAEVLVRTAENEQLFPQISTENNSIRRDLVAEESFVKGDTFRAAADVAAGVEFPVEVIADEDRGVLIFHVESLSPERSQEIANAWATTYVRLRSQVAGDDVLEVLDAIKRNIATKEAELEVVLQPLTTLDDAIRQFDEGTPEWSRINAERANVRFRLTPSKTFLESEIRVLTIEQAELELVLLSVGTQNLTARINRVAKTPTAPNPNGLARNVALAVAAGLVIGITAALMRESARDRILTPDELRDITGASILSSIPKVRTPMLHPSIERHARPPFLTEALQRLVSSTLYAAEKKGARSIVVTSALAGEGKTTVASNLAVHIGRQGHKVLLVGADMRRPSLTRLIGYQSESGLADYLEAAEELREVVVPVVELENVSLLAAGTPTRNPAELLRSNAFNNLLTSALADYDYVIIDAPPLLPVIDAVEICQCVDGAILVGRVNTAREQHLRQATELIESSGAQLIGAVLNASKPRELAIDNYYASEAEEERRTRLRNARHARRRAYELEDDAAGSDADEPTTTAVLASVGDTGSNPSTSSVEGSDAPSKRRWRRKAKTNAGAPVNVGESSPIEIVVEDGDAETSVQTTDSPQTTYSPQDTDSAQDTDATEGADPSPEAAPSLDADHDIELSTASASASKSSRHGKGKSTRQKG